MKLHYSIEVRDKNNKLYKDEKGNRIINCFKFIEKKQGFEQLICENQFKNFKAITGSENINIEIETYNSISNSYMLYASYYGSEKRYIKH